MYRRAVPGGVVEVTRDGVYPDTYTPVIRRMLDLDTDAEAIAAHLARDPWLAPLVVAHGPLRVLGGWDGFEIAVRAVMGQQVSVAGARTLNGRLVARCGTREGDRLLFPTPAQVSAADLSNLGVPASRARALKALADAALADPALFTTATVERLTAIRGVGPWTAHYVAMRAGRDPDAFPASDVGLLRGAADAAGVRPTPAELLARAEAWRPYRAYAAQYLWAADASRFESTQRSVPPR